MTVLCNICHSVVQKTLGLDSERNVTSLGRILCTDAEVFVCKTCSHSQTETSVDLLKYYAKDYKTLSAFADEDDLYEIRGDRLIFRNQHMADLLIQKLPDLNGDILDYGSGKSLVMKYYKEKTGREEIYIYDVSQDYIKFWETFIPTSQYSCFDLPELWKGKFRLVTSFFSMEHVSNPLKELSAIRRVLSEDGILYLVIPNMFSSNAADMLVVDHVQHFSEQSMKRLLCSGGFALIEVDHTSHIQASIYIAKSVLEIDSEHQTDLSMIEHSVQECSAISEFWLSVNKSVRQFEKELADRDCRGYYIIGAGVIGTHIYLQLKYPERLIGFIDSNEFKRQKGWQEKPVFSLHSVVVDSSIGIFLGFNIEQVEKLSQVMIPQGVLDRNVWNIKKVGINHVKN